MRFSAALIAALASGAIALPNYGYAEEEPCTEEEAQPTYPAASTYSVPAAQYTYPAPVYSSSSADPEETCTEKDEYVTATYPAASKYTGYGAPAYSSVYWAYPSMATYPAPVYPSGSKGTYPSGVASPTYGLMTPINSSFTPSTTSTSTTAYPDTTSTTTSSAPTSTPNDVDCGTDDNPCDSGDVPCDGCDGDPIDGGDVPNPNGPDNNGDASDAEICGSSNTPSCCAVASGQDGVFVDSPNCSAADAITGCPTGTTYCCPLTGDMSAIGPTMQCGVINLFIG